jgi:hypothetical protein
VIRERPILECEANGCQSIPRLLHTSRGVRLCCIDWCQTQLAPLDIFSGDNIEELVDELDFARYFRLAQDAMAPPDHAQHEVDQLAVFVDHTKHILSIAHRLSRRSRPHARSRNGSPDTTHSLL